MKKKHLVSVVVPCYNEEGNIEELYTRVKKVFRLLPGYNYELLYIDNASQDQSYDIYEKLAKKDKQVKVILMSRNFGSPQPSFLAGLSYASGDAVVLLHGDIQDPPEMIPQFLAQWKKGFDVVYGVRTKREGYGMMWNFYYKAFYFLLYKLSYISIPPNAGEFSLMSSRVVRELLAIPEYDYNLRCLRAFVGFPQIGIPYIRDARHHGKSTESFWSGIWWAKTIIFNFSFKPLSFISYMGIVVTILSALFLLLNLVLVLIFGYRSPGAPTILGVVLFLGGVQLISLSVIAEYISKIFLEVKSRPKYIVSETMNLQKKKL